MRAQEEAANLWVREGVQVLGIAFWHIRVLEHNARRVAHAEVHQVWAQIVELEGPTRVTSREVVLLLGDKRAGGRYKKGPCWYS